jgi:hypothetical protein
VDDSLGFFLRLFEEERGVTLSFFFNLLVGMMPSIELLPVSSALLDLRLPNVLYRCLILFLSRRSAIKSELAA